MPLTPDISPVTLAEAEAYQALRGTPAWLHAADDAAKETAIIRALDFVSINYTIADGLDWTAPAYKTAIMALAPFAVADPLIDAAQPVVTSEELTGVAKTTYGGSVSDPYPFVTTILAGVAARKSGGGFKAAKVIL